MFVVRTIQGKRRLLTAGMVILAGLLALFSLSCQAATPPPPEPAPTPSLPPAPAPEPTPEPVPEPVPEPPEPGNGLPEAPTPPEPEPGPAEKWSPDGVLGDDEYLGEMQYGNFELRWASDEEYVYIGIRAETNGWVSLGIQPGDRMKDADIIFGFVTGEEATVIDQFSTGDFGPHRPDTALGGTEDILEFGGGQADGFTTIEFKRLLDTGDEYDLPLSPGTHQIIWAYGRTDSTGMMHSQRGYGEIQL